MLDIYGIGLVLAFLIMNFQNNIDEDISGSNGIETTGVFHDTVADHLDGIHNKNLEESPLSSSSMTSEQGNINLGVGLPMLDMRDLLDTYQLRIVSVIREEMQILMKEQFDKQNKNIERIVTENTAAINELGVKYDKLRSQVGKVQIDKEVLIRDVSDLKQSHSSLNQDYVDACKQISEMEEKIKGNDNTILKLQSELTILNARLSNQEKKHDNLDQYGRRLNLEIHGYKQKDNENVIDIVKEVAKMLNVTVKNEDISAAHRLGPRENEENPGIIVRFCRQNKRDEIYRKKANLMKLNDEKDIFLNENLSDLQRDLFYQARRIKKEKGYRYAYTYHGNVYVRKTKGADALKISCLADLDKIQ